MCGINGIISYHASASAPDRSELVATRDRMTPRGPDGADEWWSEDGRAALGHRRLSIIDLSNRASQPMSSSCGRYVITFNGEIYNYRELRDELVREGVEFRTHSDTEVLLELFARHGDQSVRMLRGMFGYAIWDNERQRLFLARDPYGIKPVYFSDDGKTFRFASQVKALMAGGAISNRPSPAGVVGFYLWGSVPEPHTFYDAIRALPAGHYLWVDQAGAGAATPYFSLTEHLRAGAEQPAHPDDIDAIVREAAVDSVAAHLVADVEVGLFLSAGIDSSSLLGLMRDAGAEKIRAITLAFSEFKGTSEDESIIAAQMAEFYGARHIVRFVDEAEFFEDLPVILDQMDQPTIDGVNTYFVSKAAHEAGLKVALSGMGGDELLAGYPSFGDIPGWVSKMRAFKSHQWLGRLARMVLVASGVTRNNPKIAGMAEYGGTYPGAYLLKRGLFMPWELSDLLGDQAFVAEGLGELDPLGALEATLDPDPVNDTARIAALEGAHYMNNQLLRDSDWSGMAHSLEIRTPFVDVEFLRKVAHVTPLLEGRRGKAALSRAPSVPLPDEVRERAKTGFHVPTGSWLERAAQRGSPTRTKGQASREWARHVFESHMRAFS